MNGIKSRIKVEIKIMNPKNNILSIDLCSRLPYGVKVLNSTFATPNVQTLLGRMSEDTFIMRETYKEVSGHDHRIVKDEVNYTGDIDHIKPFLRSMSSMTDKEKSEYNNYLKRSDFTYIASLLIDWLNERHFDYNGLIEMGLAIKVTEENNPYK